jgi:hypothetical protein
MLTLTYGYQLPETNDRGPTVFPALEDNIQQLNDHNHDGANSAKLTASAIEGFAQNVLAAGWVSQPEGLYRQLVTMPGAFDYDKISITVRLSTGEYVVPTIEKVSATQFYIYTNDNTVAYIVLLGN